MPVKAKYIKDLPLKRVLDGSESLLVQDLNGTQQAPLGTIVDEIKQNSQEKIREIKSELAQTNAQLSKKASESDLLVQKARIDEFVTLQIGSTTGDAELIDGRIGIDSIVYKNIGDAIRSQLTNGYNLTKKLPISDDITKSTIDGKYYGYSTNYNGSLASLNSVYTGVVENVIPGEKYRVKVYTLGSKELNICNFYTSSGVVINHDNTNFYGYTVIDEENKILEFTAPPYANKMTYTNNLTDKSKGFCRHIMSKMPIDWLQVSDSNLSKDLKNKVDDINNGLRLTTTNKLSDNIVNLYDWGYYLDPTGNKISKTGMGTAYFDVVEGNTYQVKVYIVDENYIKGNFAVIYFWDKSGLRISPTTYEYTVTDDSNKIIEIIAPVGAVKGTITYKDDEDYFIYQKGGKKNFDWLEVSENNLSNDLKTKICIDSDTQLKYGHSLDKPFDFNGKSITFFGDSITAGSTSPSLAVTPNPYCKIFADKFGMNFSNQAVGGTTICDTVNENSILNKVLNYTTQRDFIVIAGGTNDWTLGKPVGNLGDTTGDTFYGALHVICQHLKENHANTTIIFITPINQNVTRPLAITTLDTYRNAIFEVATSNGFNVVDGSQIGFPSAQGAFANVMCSDGVHPSELGHQFYAKSLCSILC